MHLVARQLGEPTTELRLNLIEAASGGLINQSFIVTGARRAVLQRVSPIFSPTIHDNIQAVTNRLAAAGLLTPALIPARDAEQQAAFVAARVLELRDEGVPLDEMAVLYRSHFHALDLQLELTRRGIPYEVRSGVRFSTLEAICHELQCKPGDILDCEPEEPAVEADKTLTGSGRRL